MAQLNGLPVYYIKVNEALDSNQGIDMISLVDHPAIEKNWVAMSNDKRFTFNSDKQLLYGPILIPDMPIYRFSQEMGEYYVVFTKEEIVKMVRKFQAQQKTINLNYQHKDNSKIANAVVQEIWIVDSPDKSTNYVKDLPVGSAFVVAHIGDQKFWSEEVKSGNVRGFSIEGFLDMHMKTTKKNIMSTTTEKFITANLPDGGKLSSEGEAFTVGAMANYTGTDGVEKPADGQYTLDNGMVIKCVTGKIEEIMEAETPANIDSNELSAEETKVIQSAVAPLFAEMKKELEELKTKLSQIPGKPEKKKEQEPTKLSMMERIRQASAKK